MGKGATAVGVVVGEAKRGVEACGSPSHFGWEGGAGRHSATGRSLPGWSFASDNSQGNVSSGPLEDPEFNTPWGRLIWESKIHYFT